MPDERVLRERGCGDGDGKGGKKRKKDARRVRYLTERGPAPHPGVSERLPRWSQAVPVTLVSPWRGWERAKRPVGDGAAKALP